MNKDLHNYDDIIDLEHPEPKNHTRMDKIMRAAQFAPFAALKGYEEAIIETGRYVEKKIELTYDEQDKISSKLRYLSENIDKNLEISVTYFIKDQKKNGGIYQTKEGILKRIDKFNLFLQFTDKGIIYFKDILAIDGIYFDNF